MKSIINALKSRAVLASFAVLFVMQLFTTFTIVYIVMFTDVYIADASNDTEGITAFMIGTVLAQVAVVVLFAICLSRLRSIYIVGFNVVVAILALLLALFGPMMGLILPQFFWMVFLFFYWQYFLVYGVGYIFYYRSRNVFLTIFSNAFWFFSIIVVSVSDRLPPTNSFDDSFLSNNFGILWRGPEVIFVLIYLILIAILLLVDMNFSLKRWQRDLKSKVSIRKRNFVFFAGLTLVVLILVSFLAPLFWRVRWVEEQRKKAEEIERQRPTDQNQQQKPPSIGEEPGEEQNPGGQLPKQSPGGEDVPFALVRYGETEGEGHLDINSEKTSDELAPNFVGLSPAQVQQLPNVPGESEEGDEPEAAELPKQYFRSEAYDNFSSFQGFRRNFMYDYLGIDGRKVRGYYRDTGYSRYSGNKELYQTVILLGGDSQLVFGNTEIFEVGFLAPRPSPYFFGYGNGVVVTSDANKLMRGDTFYVLSNVPGVDRTQSSGEAKFKLESRPSFSVSNSDLPSYSGLYDSEIQTFVRGITSHTDNYYAQALAIEKYLQENYKYDPALDNMDGLIEAPKEEEQEQGAGFTNHDINNGGNQNPLNDIPTDLQNPTTQNTQAIQMRDLKRFILSTPGSEANSGSSSMFAAAFSALMHNANSLNRTRVVAGFRTSQYDEEFDAFVLSTKDLHYWNEVYFPTLGWITFDVLAEIKGENPEQEFTPKQQEDLEDKLDEGEEKIEDREEYRDKIKDENDLGQGYDEIEDYNDDNTDKYDSHDDDPLNGQLPDQKPPKTKEPLNFGFLENIMKFLSAMLQILWRIWPICCCIFILLAIAIPPLSKYLRWIWNLEKAGKQSDQRAAVAKYYGTLQKLLAYFALQQKGHETDFQYVQRLEKELQNSLTKLDEGDEKEIKKSLIKEINADLTELADIHNQTVYDKDLPSGDFVARTDELIRNIAGNVVKLKRGKIPQAIYLKL